VYVTAHRSFPKNCMEESLKEIRHFSPGESEINLYWTSWFELYKILSHTENALNWEHVILDDLQKLLERKRFVQFRGYLLDKIREIHPGVIYKRRFMKKIVGYQFLLEKEKVHSHPLFYTSHIRLHEYLWDFEAEEMSFTIYKGGSI